jgi:phosphonate transport system substrate-binding protein
VRTTAIEGHSDRSPSAHGSRRARRLRVASCLAPHLGWFYRSVCCHLGRHLGAPTEFRDNAEYDQLGDVDIAFVCSLAYIELPAVAARFEPLAAPVLAGARYGGQPVYYSDVVVHERSRLRSFADLRGRSWAYNEVYSQSGYGITRYHLAQAGKSRCYFGCVMEAGTHDRAIRLVAEGRVDAAAIDSHCLETYLRLYPELARALRVIGSLGPSPVQPVLARRSLPKRAKQALGATLVGLGADPAARRAMARALVERFVHVDDQAYDPVRRMREVVAAAGLLLL